MRRLGFPLCNPKDLLIRMIHQLVQNYQSADLPKMQAEDKDQGRPNKGLKIKTKKERQGKDGQDN